MTDYEKLYRESLPRIIQLERIKAWSAEDLLERHGIEATNQAIDELLLVSARVDSDITPEDEAQLRKIIDKYRSDIRENIRTQHEAGGSFDAGMPLYRALIEDEWPEPVTRTRLHWLASRMCGIYWGVSD